ncbi:hypothetical protein OH77DRAFT_1507583 [Trametes cingulata]|nr:hypothetical protein OH77DRAFT_1507583 [Trametes cingulata]
MEPDRTIARVAPFCGVSAPRRTQPLLVIQTDIPDLSPSFTSLLPQDIDIPNLLVVPSRASSMAPDDYDSDGSSGVDLSLSSVPDDDNDDDDNGTKPITEDALEIHKLAGSPKRGGYKLEDALHVIHNLVEVHLDPTRSFAGQSDRRSRIIRDETVQRVPDLGMYEQEWPATGAVQPRLKFTSSKAGQNAHDAVPMAPQKKRADHKQ